MNVHVNRATVRGQFERLSPDQSRILTRHAASHDVTAAAYTSGGTFIYDHTHRAFSFRYEIRVEVGDRTSADETAATRALELAGSYLDQVQLPHKRPPGVCGEHGRCLGQPRRSPLGWKVAVVAVATRHRCETSIRPGSPDTPSVCSPWWA